MPRQKLPAAYVHTGAMDVMWRDTIFKLKSTSGRKVKYFFMNEEDSVNIDSPVDFLLAEVIMNRMKNKRRLS